MNLNEKQIVLLVCGLFVLVAAICFGAWAFTGGPSNHPEESARTQEEESSSDEMQVRNLRQRPQYHFWVDDTAIDPHPLEGRRGSRGNYRRNESDLPFRNQPELLDRGDFYEAADKHGADLITFSYLSLSVFLLKQMDHLLEAQSEVTRGSSRSIQRAEEEKPQHFNSLNILLIDSKRLKNATNLDDMRTEEFSNNYAQFGVNLIKASQMDRADGSGIDCIWTAYCIELNKRASLKGMVGSIARINGIVLGLMSGQLMPAQALERLVPSLMMWTDLQCSTLFPRCGADEAMDYLQQLAYTPNE